MSTVMNIKADGKEFILNSLHVSFSRKASDDTALPTSNILGGTVDMTMMFEAETDSDTFFASWFQESGKKHTIDIDVLHLAGTGDKFLSMKIKDAQCTVYALAHKATSDLSSPEENSILEVQVVSPSITIGQATINVGE